MEIQSGAWGISRTKILKGMHEPKLEFPDGGWIQTQKPSFGGEYVIFSGISENKN